MTYKTISDLKEESAKIRAIRARAALSEAMKQSRQAEIVIDAALSVISVLSKALTDLPETLAQAIDGAHDETRVHYLLSDAVHTWLEAIGQRAEAASAALPEFGSAFRRGSRPRRLMTVSQHADRYRYLMAGTNAPGKWRT